MGLAELVAILATMGDLFAVIAAPILPPIDIVIIDRDTETGIDHQPDGTIEAIIADMNAAARGIPSLIGPRGSITFHPQHSLVDDGASIEQNYVNWRRHQQRVEEISSENTVPSRMHRNIPGPLNTASFAKGMARRSALFGQLIALGSMTLDVDADPDAMRAADMVRAFTEGRRRALQLFEPYIEDPDTTDPAS